MEEKEILRICKNHGETTFRLTKDKINNYNKYNCVKCASARVSKRRRKLKQLLVEEHGGRCKICGYNKCINALEFHHLDKESKKFGIAEKGVTRSYDKAKEETDKCVLLCSNCHREVESGFTKL